MKNKKKVHPAVSQYYSKLAMRGAKKRAERLIAAGLLKVGPSQTNP